MWPLTKTIVARTNITSWRFVMNTYIEFIYSLSYRERKELSNGIQTFVIRQREACKKIEKLRAYSNFLHSQNCVVSAPARKFFFQKITKPSIFISKSWDFNWIMRKGWILSWYNRNLNIIIISVFIFSLNVSDKWKFVIRSNITKFTVVMNAYIELKYFLSYRARKELSKDMVTCVYREKQTCANIEKLRASISLLAPAWGWGGFGQFGK